MRRNGRRRIITNDHPMYAQMRDERGRKFINHYVAANMRHPTADDLVDIDTIHHIWQSGDRFSKLSALYYGGNVKFWWVIAWFNQKPTDHDVAFGDIIEVPVPLDRVLDILEV